MANIKKVQGIDTVSQDSSGRLTAGNDFTPVLPNGDAAAAVVPTTSILNINGSLGVPCIYISGSATPVLELDETHCYIDCDTVTGGASNVTIQLPTGSIAPGRIYIVKKVTVGSTVYINANAGDSNGGYIENSGPRTNGGTDGQVSFTNINAHAIVIRGAGQWRVISQNGW